MLETASGKVLCVTHTPAIKSNLFCLAHNRLSRVRNAVKNKVRWPRKPTSRETAKQTPTCHFQDETERLLNVAQKMLCKQKIGFCLPALDFQFSLASGGCFFSSFNVCTDLCFHLNLLAYPCSQTDSSSALTNLKAGRESHRALPQLGTHSHANPSPNEDLTGNAPLLVLSRNQTRRHSP